MRSYLFPVLLLSALSLGACSTEGEAENPALETESETTVNDSDEVGNDEEGYQDHVETNAKLVWDFYHNQRFDFCLEYPSNFLTSKGESENHDGNTFVNANGSSEMRASGIYNALDETVAEAFERATENENYYDEEKKITYKSQKDNWFVISGNYNESIFYVKSILVEDTFYTLYFEYHSSEAHKFDEIIKRTTKDFPNC